jgi:uncharacterized iron-regulated membrane protein
MTATAAQPSVTRRSAREWFDLIHRWLGLGVGLLLVMAGLTGTILSFYMEIERSFFSNMQTIDPHGRPASWEAVYQRLEALPKDPGGNWRIEMPKDGGPITSRYVTPATEHFARMTTLDPTTLKVIRDTRWHSTFFTWIYDLHEALLVRPIGQKIMGIASILMVAMLAVGLVNWLLRPEPLKAKLGLRKYASATRRSYDLHNVAGLILLVPLLLSVVTAIMLSLPDQTKGVLGAVSPLKNTAPPVHSTLDPAHPKRIPLDMAIAIALERFPGGQVIWMRTPGGPQAVYDIQMREADAPHTRFPRSHVWIDQYSGRVLATYGRADNSLGDVLLFWMIPIHEGTAYGLAGRIFIGVLGLIPLALFLTSAIPWLQRQLWRRRMRKA